MTLPTGCQTYTGCIQVESTSELPTNTSADSQLQALQSNVCILKPQKGSDFCELNFSVRNVLPRQIGEYAQQRQIVFQQHSKLLQRDSVSGYVLCKGPECSELLISVLYYCFSLTH